MRWRSWKWCCLSTLRVPSASQSLFFQKPSSEIFNRMLPSSHANRPKAQTTEVAYELHTLGWKAFQNLCVTITGEVWGQTVQSFFDSHDRWRDGAFHGKWKSKDGESFEGSFTAQCKFTAKANKQLQLADLKDELRRLRVFPRAGFQIIASCLPMPS